MLLQYLFGYTSAFWELDSPSHNQYLSYNDLYKYDDNSLTNRVVERIINGHARPLLSDKPSHLNYDDFIIFLISEVDKTSDVSIDYWFNVIDLDGDGVITGYEIEYFWEEQKERIYALSNETLNFTDILCQLIDAVKRPAPHPGYIPTLYNNNNTHTKYDGTHLMNINITRKDLKSSGMSTMFFNTLFNLNKFILNEQRDPLRIKHIHDTPELTEW